MFKYLIVLALALAAVMAAAPQPQGAPKDLEAAQQFYSAYGYGYPSVYSAGVYPSAYSGYSAYGGYPYYGGYRAGLVYGR